MALARRWPVLALAGLLVVPALVDGAVAPERVVWTDLVNVSAKGNALRKAGGCDGCADAGARSRQQLTGEPAYLEFSSLETTKLRFVGLSTAHDTDPKQ